MAKYIKKQFRRFQEVYVSTPEIIEKNGELFEKTLIDCEGVGSDPPFHWLLGAGTVQNDEFIHHTEAEARAAGKVFVKQMIEQKQKEIDKLMLIIVNTY